MTQTSCASSAATASSAAKPGASMPSSLVMSTRCTMGERADIANRSLVDGEKYRPIITEFAYSGVRCPVLPDALLYAQAAQHRVAVFGQTQFRRAHVRRHDLDIAIFLQRGDVGRGGHHVDGRVKQQQQRCDFVMAQKPFDGSHGCG